MKLASSSNFHPPVVSNVTVPQQSNGHELRGTRAIESVHHRDKSSARSTVPGHLVQVFAVDNCGEEELPASCLSDCGHRILEAESRTFTRAPPNLIGERMISFHAQGRILSEAQLPLEGW